MTIKGKQNHHNIKFLKGYGFSIKVLRNSRLRSSIRQNQISEIGKIKEVTKQFNLNGDRKRLWLGKIESIDSKVMNDSIPVSMTYFKKNEI